jgi:hypothetical protein
MEYTGTKDGTSAGQVTCHEEIMAHTRAWCKEMKADREATEASIQKK